MAEPVDVPEAPHMSPEGIRKLTDLLRSARCYLEYGAGGSTRLAASLNVPIIVSVESDRAYGDAVAKAVGCSGSKSSLQVLLCDIGPTGEWGRPLNDSAARSWPDYSTKVWRHLREHGLMPTFVLVDGRFRVACALASILNMHPGSTIMVDDYIGREKHYQIIERYAILEEVVGRAAILKVPTQTNYSDIALDLARYSVISA